TTLFVAFAHSRFWHEAAVRECPLFRRLWGLGGHCIAIDGAQDFEQVNRRTTPGAELHGRTEKGVSPHVAGVWTHWKVNIIHFHLPNHALNHSSTLAVHRAQ